MINLTVKTLDSLNHHFCVNDECTVRELKDKIREALGIDINEQRLIFCGRVLNDNTALSQYGVNGKVVHLVKGAPPSNRGSQNSSHASSSEPASDGIRIIHRVVNPPLQQLRQHWMQFQPLLSSDTIPDPQVAMSPPTIRLQLVHRFIKDLRHALGRLVNQIDTNFHRFLVAQSESMDSNRTQIRFTDEEVQRLRNEYVINDSANQPGPSSRPDHPAASRWTRPRDLADVLDMLGRIYNDFAPFQQVYINMLREISHAEITTEERAVRLQLMNNVNDILHSFSHAYHSLSDISVHVGQHYPRLALHQSPPALSFPAQAHINIMPSRVRLNQNVNTTTSSESSSAANTSDARAQDTSDTPQRAATESPHHSATFFDGSSGTMVGVNITPDSEGYHVEIEARFPTVQMGNLAQQNTGQTPQNPGDQSQERETQDQVIRPHMLEIENVLRDLTQDNGVEVLMNVEDSSVAGLPPPPTTGPPDNAPPGNAPFTLPQGGVLLAPLTSVPGGSGNISADLLQNVLLSVLNNQNENVQIADNAGPVMPPEMVHIDVSSANAPNPTPRNNTTSANTATLAAMARARAIGRRLVDNDENRPIANVGSTERARLPSARGLPVAPYAEYDPYLSCYSQHARSRLMGRRAPPRERGAGSSRRRAADQAPLFRPVENICRNFSNPHDMCFMYRLLNGGESDEAAINAFFYLVGGQMHGHAWTGCPVEFPAVRRHLRAYFQGLVDIVPSSGSGCDSIASIINYIVNRFNEFAKTKIYKSTLDRRYNHLESLRALLHARFTPIFVQSMCTCISPTIANNYYILCRRLYIDFASLFSEICVNSVALTHLMENLVTSLISGFEGTTRRWLDMFIRENNVQIRRAIDVNGIRQFLRSSNRTNEQSDFSDDDDDEEEEEFEVPLPCEPSRSTVMPPQPSQLPHAPPPAIPRPQHNQVDCHLHPAAPPLPLDEAQARVAADSARPTPDQSSTSDENNGRNFSPDDEEFEVPLPCEPSRRTVMPPQPSGLPLLPPPAIPRPQHNSIPNLHTASSNADVYDFDNADHSLENGNLSVVQSESTSEELPFSSGSSSAQVHPIVQQFLATATDDEDMVSLEVDSNSENQKHQADAAALPAGHASTASSTMSSPESMGSISWCVEQFEEAWAPALLERDRRAPPTPPEPASDGYLSGMPSRKRRSVTESRPSQILDEFINEATRDIENSSMLSENPNVRAIVVDTLRALTAERAHAAPDGVPERLANLDRWVARDRENAARDHQYVSNTDETRSKRMRKNP